MNQYLPYILLLSQSKITWEVAALGILAFLVYYAWSNYVPRQNSYTSRFPRSLREYENFEKFAKSNNRPDKYIVKFYLNSIKTEDYNCNVVTSPGIRVYFAITNKKTNAVTKGYEFNSSFTKEETTGSGTEIRRTTKTFMKRTLVITYSQENFLATDVYIIIDEERKFINRNYSGHINICKGKHTTFFNFNIDDEKEIYRSTFIQLPYKKIIKQIDRFVNDKKSFAPADPKVTACFIGPAGNGKSLFPTAVAKYYRLNLRIAKPSDLHSLESLDNLFCVYPFIVIPEIDGFVSDLIQHHRRQKTEIVYSEEKTVIKPKSKFDENVTLKEVLETIDGTFPIGQIIMASSNNPEVLDYKKYDDPIEREFILAFTRKGRFNVVEIENPTIEEAHEYAESLGRTLPKDFERCNMAELTELLNSE